MRGALLGSTAPLSVMLALVPGSTAAGIDVTVGGYTAFRAGIFDVLYTSTTGRDFVQDAAITVDAKSVTRAGLAYGAATKINAATSEAIVADETYIYAEGRYGHLELGDNDSPSDRLSVFAPTVGIGQINGKYVDFIPYALRPSGNIKDTGGGIFKPLDSDDATKIIYFSPRIHGVQVGISYAPEGDSLSDGEGVQLSKTAGRQRDFVEAGLHYRTTISPLALGLNAALTATHAKAKSGMSREDVTAWAAGLQVAYKSLTMGGNFVNNGNSNQPLGAVGDSETAWTLGLSYRKNAWDMAVNLAHENYGAAGGRYNNGGSYSALVMGGSRQIAQGVSAGLDLAYYVRKRANGIDDGGSVIILETKAVF